MADVSEGCSCDESIIIRPEIGNGEEICKKAEIRLASGIGKPTEGFYVRDVEIGMWKSLMLETVMMVKMSEKKSKKWINGVGGSRPTIMLRSSRLALVVICAQLIFPLNLSQARNTC